MAKREDCSEQEGEENHKSVCLHAESAGRVEEGARGKNRQPGPNPLLGHARRLEHPENHNPRPLSLRFSEVWHSCPGPPEYLVSQICVK